MSWLNDLTVSRISQRNLRKTRAWGVELLDDRTLLSVSPVDFGSAGYPNPFDDDDLGPIGPVAQVSEISNTFHVAKIVRSGDLGYPSPDDDGDWGPLGPVVRDAITVAVESLTIQELGPDPTPWASISVVVNYDIEPDPQPWIVSHGSTLSASSAYDFGYYPNPEDDDGGWGPIGPVVHVFVADSFANLSEQSGIVARSGGSFYPNPEDDDGGWGPIGPVVRDVFTEFDPTPMPWAIATVFLNIREVNEANPEPQPWITDVLVDADRLVVIANPDPSLGGGGGGVYPNPEGDDDWGPLGPVVKHVAELDRAIGEVADDSTSYERADATNNVAILDRAFADLGVPSRSLRG